MSSHRTAWLFAASFWVLFGLISGIQVWISMRTHGHSVPLLLGFNLAIWTAWLVPTPLVVWLARRFPVIPFRPARLLMHFGAACAVGLGHAFYWVTLLFWMKPFDKMMKPRSEFKLPEKLLECLPLEWALYCLVIGCSMAFDYYERYRERALQAAKLEASLADARIHALKLQIQPHFLFNTMNAITSLVRNRRNDEAVEMIAGLSELLRYTLDHAGQQRVALEEELSVLRRYLEIQRMRFPDRMSFQIDLSPEARRGTVPAFLLQPLAENAVRHGIAQSSAPGVVEVRAFRADDCLRIDVFNSGMLSATPSRGVGLSNTIERLKHLYGDNGKFDLANGNGGVTATVSIPWSEAT